MVIDVSQASDARVNNLLLGGTDHYESDREAVRRLAELAPNIRQLARLSRQFLLRAVRYLAAERGIGQFLDHGAGLPTRENVHQVARRVHKSARVVYIDNDPVVLAHARMMLDEDQTLILDADMLDTDSVLSRCERAGFLNCRAPVGVLFASALHCVADEQAPWRHLENLMDRLPSGSCLVLSHLVSEDAARREEASRLMRQLTGRPWTVRSAAEVDQFFDGLRPVGGPIGDVAHWKPGLGLKLKLADLSWIAYGGVARKP
ncbi:SAM-dependent methyltransferase [Streptomyces sp. bgisy034]|uniref:SAM-dependent methyltransferase n=1 Tax=Streptomyces sp. bgisy034 TaxID=3413774 RepID=UPI003EBFE543